MTLFSLVLPTVRGRADTFASALRTLVRQEHADIEVVVQSNGDDPEVSAVVERLGDDRVKLFATSEVLPISATWELALSHTTGEWVTVIGDDDGLLPDACAIASAVSADVDVEVLSWRSAQYYW